jgi:hypothetical protein
MEINGVVKTVLTENEMASIRDRIDWFTLVLRSLRDCNDTDTMTFGIQQVVKGLSQVLSEHPVFQDKKRSVN